MRIRISLTLTTLAFGIILAGASASSIITDIQVDRAVGQDRIAHRVALRAGELSLLADNYLLLHELGQPERWTVLFAGLHGDMATLHAAGAEEQALVRSMQAQVQTAEEIMGRLLSAAAASASDSEAGSALSDVPGSGSRLEAASQELVAETLRLSQLLGERVDRLQSRNSATVLGLVAILAVYFLVSHLVTQRRLLSAIARLRAGTAAIGSGHLDFRVEENRDDEIGELARALNRMAADLQELNETLEHQVAARTARLRESEEKLRAVFDAIFNGVFEYDATGMVVRANPAAIALVGADPVQSTAAELASRLDMRHPDPTSPMEGGRPVVPAELTVSRALKGESVPAQPFVYTHPDGQQVSILASATPLFDGRRVSGAVVVWLDITQRQALEQALHAEAHRSAVIEERQRLARELHDAVSQILFTTGLVADVLPGLWERDPEDGRRALQQIRRLTRGALAEMRSLLLELRPAELLQARFETLLAQLADAFAARSQAHIELSGEEIGPLPPDVQVALFRIAQETLSNVYKHAHAGTVSIRLRCENGLGPPRVSLCIADDGQGFDPHALPPERMGLHIMRERAEKIGAELSIETAAGQGTRVTCTWPLPTHGTGPAGIAA